MTKTILASITAVALLALAACDGGSQTPESGDPTGATTTTTPTTPPPADTGTAPSTDTGTMQ